jgi:hypothetical protein
MMPAPTALEFRRVTDAAVEDAVSPPHEERRHEERRQDTSSDASRLTFTLPMVLAMLVCIAGTAFGMGAMQYFFQTSDRAAATATQEAVLKMQSDIRSISERIDSQSKIDEANKRADAAERSSQVQSYESTKQAVDSMRGVVQLLQLQVAELLKQKR